MAAFAYYVPVDMSDAIESYGTITLSTSGKPNVVVNLATLDETAADGGADSSIFFHHLADPLPSLSAITGHDEAATDHIASVGRLAVNRLQTTLTTAMQAEATAQGWASPSGLGIAFDVSTLLYTVSYGTALTAVAFSNANSRALFGFASNWSGSSTSVSGTRTPDYVISPTLTDVALDTPEYEPDALASIAITDSGDVYGMARTIGPLYRDWVQQYETKAKTIRRSADGAHPCTFQKLFEKCRTTLPFFVESGFAGSSLEAFVLRADGAHFGRDICQRASEGNDGQFHIHFRALALGTVA